MPPTTHIQRTIGETIAAGLSSLTLPGDIDSVVATYGEIPDHSIENIPSLRVTVVSGPLAVGSTDFGNAPRGMQFWTARIGIVVQCPVENDDDIKRCEGLCQDLMDALADEHVDLPEGCDWGGEIEQPIKFDVEEARNRRLFVSQIVASYHLARQKTAKIGS
jgi:hypothetical protein